MALRDGLERNRLNEGAKRTPTDWFGGDRVRLDLLLDQLYERNEQVRDKLQFFGSACPKILPSWTGDAFCAGSAT
jgi:hypothetical protein